jgi:hypothetical protein
MEAAAPGGRVRRVVIRTILVLLLGGAVLAPILYYASTVDVRPPEVSRFSLTQHLPGDDDVALTTASMEIVFSEGVNRDSAEHAFRIQPDVGGAFTWSGTTLIFTPNQRLPLETSFSVALQSGVTDPAGNRMGGWGPQAFRTVGGPSVVASSPVDGATDVLLRDSITLTFSTLMDTASVQAALHIEPQTDVSLRWSGTQLAIVPTQPLLPGSRYVVDIGANAHDLGGTAIDPLQLAFTTISSSLTARTIVPARGTQGIAVTTPIAVMFDRAVDPGTVNDRSLVITPSVPGSLTLTTPEGAAALAGADRRVLRFTPSGPLPVNTTLFVTVSSAVRGVDGSELSAPVNWSFTTGSPSASLGNQVVFLSARSGTANLWAMNPDGSYQHQVSAELSPITSYAVAPDGRSFVVGDGLRLVAQRADGSNRRVLTDAGLVEFDPSFAPDDSTIVFGRADAKTGGGLGIWRRPAGGGSAERIVAAPLATPSPSASPQASAGASGAPSGSAAPEPVLRAPRYSPDGAQLAFLDMSGSVDILDLASAAVTIAPAHAVSPPSWFSDGSGVLVTALPDPTGSDGTLPPGTAAPSLDPQGMGLNHGQRSRLGVLQVRPGDPVAAPLPLDEGAVIADVDRNDRVAYVLPQAFDSDAGTLFLASRAGLVTSPVTLPSGSYVAGMSFAPQPGTLVVACVPAPSVVNGGATASPSASPAESAAGIWLIDLVADTEHHLTVDGSQPEWLP